MGGKLATRARVLLSVGLAGGVMLTALAAGLAFRRHGLDTYDTKIMFAVTQSIVTTHTTYVPPSVVPFHISSPHASYGLGMSLLSAPILLLAPRLGRSPQAMVMLINPMLFPLVALSIWIWARVAGATLVRATVIALVTAFGTRLLPDVQTGFSEMGCALGVAIAILGVELGRRRALLGGLVAGAGVSVAVLMRPDSVLLVAVPVGLALLIQTWRALPTLVIGAAPGGLVTYAYNLHAGASYQGFTLRQGFSHPFLVGVQGLLISPSRGLLLYAPLVVVAVLAVPWAWRRSPVITGLCLSLLVIRIPFYASWYAWQGGWAWGPRFLTPAMPALAPLLLPVLRWPSWRQLPLAVPVAAVTALSVSIQFLGAAVGYDTDSANLALDSADRAVAQQYQSHPIDFKEFVTSSRTYAARDEVLFDWRYFPILEHARKIQAAGYSIPR